MDEFSLSPAGPSPDDTGITLSPDEATPPIVSQTTAENRAAKAHAGLKNVIDKSYDDYLNSIRNGQENALRTEISNQVNSNRASNRQQAIIDYANSKGGALTTDDIRQVDLAIQRNDVFNGTQDPRSVFEEHYAKQYANAIHWPLAPKNQDELHWWKEAVQEVPEVVVQEQQKTQLAVAQREYILKTLEDLQAEREQQSTLGKVGEFALSSIPFQSEYMLRGNIPYEGFALTRPGALEAQRLELVSKPDFDSFKDSLDQAVAGIKATSLSDAIEFTDAMLGQSQSERAMGIAAQVGDISTIPGGAIANVARKAILKSYVKTAFKSVEDSTAATTVRPVEVAAAAGAGDLETAAARTATADAVRTFVGKSDPALESRQGMQSVFDENANKIAAGPGNFGQEKTNRLVEQWGTFKDRLFDMITIIAKVERIPVMLAAKDAVDAEIKRIAGDYPGIRNAVINITPPYRNELMNTWHADIIIGQYNADFFTSKAQAEIFAQQSRLKGFKADNTNSGNGWYLRYQVPVRETSFSLRNTLLDIAGVKSPDSNLQVFLGWMGWARSPDDVLSAENTWARKTVSYGANQLINLFKEEARSIKELSKGKYYSNLTSAAKRERYRQWKSVVEAQRDLPDPLNPGRKGRFFDSPADLEHYYQANFGRLPDDLEYRAYYAYVRMNRMDWALRNIDLYKFMSREGMMDWQLSAFKNVSDRQYSSWIPAMKSLTLPAGDQGILVLGKNVGQERFYSGTMSAKMRKEIQQGITDGKLQLIRLWNPGHFPLSTWGGRLKAGDRVEYVISSKFGNRPLNFNQLPVRDGGHIEYDYTHYIKQARITPQRVSGKGATAKFVHWYDGDTTVMPVQLRALGEDAIKVLNEAREHLAAGNHALAATALRKLPIPYKEFRSWFTKQDYVHPTTGEKISVPARLSKTEPFYVVPKDKMIIDLSDELQQRYFNKATGVSTFRDGTKTGSLANQYRVAFTGERDTWEMYALHDKGSRHKPLYAYEPATKVDAMTTLNRGLSRITHSFFMDDYKIMAIEHWIQEAKQYLKADNIKEIDQSPFYFFYKGEWRGAMPFELKQKLEIARMQIKLFMGEPSWLDTQLNAAMTKLADSIYGEQSSIGRAGLQFAHWSIPTITNTGRFLRSAVYHVVMGMFNWVQMIVQNMTYVNILGIAGLNSAYHGVLGATLHQFGRLAGALGKDIGKALDKIASKMGGFKPGEFLEAREILNKRTGFGYVGQEHIVPQHYMQPTIFKGIAGDFLHAGDVFFREGEKHARFGAWYVAYKEFRKANPTGAITNHDIQGMVNRADLLSGNMTNASKSMLQRGPLSFSTQFLGYQLRLAEQLAGKRLTKIEKARLLAYNAAIYGLPATTGLVGIPFGEAIKEEAYKRGYIIGDSWYWDILMHGLPAYGLAFINGGGDPQAGIQYNIGDRYGAPGFDFLRDAWWGDATLVKMLGGATAGTLISAYVQMDGLLKTLYSTIADGGATHPFTWDDVLDGARIINSVNAAYRGILAANTYSWTSRRGIQIDTLTSSQDSIFRSLLGLTSQEAQDYPIQQHINKSLQDDLYKTAESLYIKEMHNGFTAYKDDNPDQGEKYFARARGILEAADVPLALRTQFLRAAAQSDEDMITRINWQFYMGRNVPQSMQEGREKQFETLQSIRAKKGLLQ